MARPFAMRGSLKETRINRKDLCEEDERMKTKKISMGETRGKQLTYRQIDLSIEITLLQ